MKYSKYLLLILLMHAFKTYNAQDIHFSKFLSAPLILNPANTTNYHGNWALITNYRNQGYATSDPYVTSSVAFDFPLYFKTERAGIGLIWINDQSSQNTLNVNKIFLSTAYFIKISKFSYLHMGLQAGYVHKTYNFDNLTFPDQFDMSQGYFNPDFPTNEILTNTKLSYLDLNWGLIWSVKKETFTFETGTAMFHYNTPDESFSSIENKLKPRYVFHAFIEKLIFKNYFVKPKILCVYQNKASELLVGLSTGIIFPENKTSKNFNIGVFFRGGFNRNLNAMIIKTGFNFKNYEISIGYDTEIPGQKLTAYPVNTIELSISYKRPETTIKNKTIPCTIF
jgi:type IX secretion system PorP/SprF family membrane protein